MARLAASSPETIRATILSMLAEAHDSQPATRERFRRIVSVRKLRERLGAGDPATLGRAINAIESELVTAGMADIALPDIPAEIAEQMRQLWHAAVSVQLDDVVRLKQQATQSAEQAQAAQADMALRAEVLKQEVTELRALLATRDTELAQARADHAALMSRFESLQENHQATLDTLSPLRAELAAMESAKVEAIAAAQQRYEGLSRQLLLETAQQRQAAQQEVQRLSQQLQFAERRTQVLEAALAQAQADAAAERTAKQTALGEAAALKAVNASQRAQLDELLQSTLVAVARASAAPADKARKVPAKRSTARRKGP